METRDAREGEELRGSRLGRHKLLRSQITLPAWRERRLMPLRNMRRIPTYAVGLLKLMSPVLALLIVPTHSAWAGPRNAMCTHSLATVSERYCIDRRRLPVSSLQTQCDADSHCRTVTVTNYVEDCSAWSSHDVQRSICLWSCRTGYSPVPGNSAEAGCFTPDEIARLAAQQARLAAEQKAKEAQREAELASQAAKQRQDAARADAEWRVQQAADEQSQRIEYDNCPPVSQSSLDRGATWNKALMSRRAARIFVGDGTKQVLSEDELRRLLSTNKYHATSCSILYYGVEPDIGGVAYYKLLAPVHKGDRPAGLKQANYIVLIPRAAWSARTRIFDLPAGTSEADLASACQEIAHSTGLLITGESRLLKAISIDDGVYCLGKQPGLWSTVKSSLFIWSRIKLQGPLPVFEIEDD